MPFPYCGFERPLRFHRVQCKEVPPDGGLCAYLRIPYAYNIPIIIPSGKPTKTMEIGSRHAWVSVRAGSAPSASAPVPVQTLGRGSLVGA
jgi:hypothetical protein